MNTVIVPIDFSETSLHAAAYAAQLLSLQYGTTMLLYHSYTKDEEGASGEDTLKQLKERLLKKFFLTIEILVVKEDDFVNGLDRAVRHRHASLVIMGITHRSAIGQALIGSKTLKFAETKACPVLIVPDHIGYREINNVMLATDLKDTFHTVPSAPVKAFLRSFRPKLHIVNVDPRHYIAISEEHEKEKKVLKEMFSEYNPEFYFLRLYDVDEALSTFAEERNIDLIITVQRNHSFWEKVFKKSTTKALSYQSNIPVLVIHE